MEEQTGSEGIQDSQGSSVLAEVGSGPTSSGTAGGHSSQPGGQDGPQIEELSSQFSGLNGSGTEKQKMKNWRKTSRWIWIKIRKILNLF